MKLYSYWHSSASYRLRIALALKGIGYETVEINLLKGEQRTPEFLKINPQGLVPALLDGDHLLTQSMAIIEYLDEKYPAVPLLPVTPPERARVRAIAQAMACEMGPLGNLRVRKYVHDEYGTPEKEWVKLWNDSGLPEIETMLTTSDQTGRFCHGATPTLADCILVPQLFVARRFGCDLTSYPTLSRIEAACNAHPAFIAAHPSKQPDAV